ncbi:hypothetical protein LC76P1_00055 [Lysinibacillus phage LC76P1]|nr:hypothetical protein LC76P1_00055 [Lysinibacillus phage LC76P1]
MLGILFTICVAITAISLVCFIDIVIKVESRNVTYEDDQKYNRYLKIIAFSYNISAILAVFLWGMIN